MKSGYFRIAAILIAIIFSVFAAALIYRNEVALQPPWLYTVSFGGAVNAINGGWEIIFKPQVTHNQNNDTILFRVTMVNVETQSINLEYGDSSFKINISREDGSSVPYSSENSTSDLLLYVKQLNPGEGANFSRVWRRSSDNIGKMVFAPGRYYVSEAYYSASGAKVIESPRVEMVLSPNERTIWFFDANAALWSAAVGLAVFSAVITCAYFTRRFLRKVRS